MKKLSFRNFLSDSFDSPAALNDLYTLKYVQASTYTVRLIKYSEQPFMFIVNCRSANKMHMIQVQVQYKYRYLYCNTGTSVHTRTALIFQNGAQ